MSDTGCVCVREGDDLKIERAIIKLMMYFLYLTVHNLTKVSHRNIKAKYVKPRYFDKQNLINHLCTGSLFVHSMYTLKLCTVHMSRSTCNIYYLRIHICRHKRPIAIVTYCTYSDIHIYIYHTRLKHCFVLLTFFELHKINSTHKTLDNLPSQIR